MVVCTMLAGISARAEQPVVTDSRIKTFVYNEYDVYSIYTQYGYQTNLEFAHNEEIVTVSVGDRIGWQIVPVGHRLFIRPMEEGARTNMTVITTERAYQFDLTSSKSEKLKPSEELSYVVRFYYPEEDERLRLSPPPAPTAPQSAMDAPSPAEAPAPYNYEYTFTGPDALAPRKVYDDGRRTYLKLPGAAVPGIFAVGPDGKEYPARAARAPDGMVLVDAVAPKMVLRYSESEFVCIYNEKMKI